MITNHIILSIQPQWLAKILNGEKTVEIRKTVPKLPCTVWLYCTKEKPYLYASHATNEDGYTYRDGYGLTDWKGEASIVNGQIVAKFTLEKAEEFDASMGNPRIYTKACIQDEEAFGYAKGKPLWAWYIANLTIFEKPLVLEDFSMTYFQSVCDQLMSPNGFNMEGIKQVPRAPQSWKYVMPKKGIR